MDMHEFLEQESGNDNPAKPAQTKPIRADELGQQYPSDYTQDCPTSGPPRVSTAEALRLRFPRQVPRRAAAEHILRKQLHGKLKTPSPDTKSLGPPLSLRQVAELIGLSPWSVRQTLMPRGLPYVRFTASGRLIFYRDQVVRWIENQIQGG